MNREKYVDDLVGEWDAAHVARAETFAFTGGGVEGRTVANKESEDPSNRVPGRFILGRRVMYPVREFAEWLADKLLKQTDGNGSDTSDRDPIQCRCTTLSLDQENKMTAPQSSTVSNTEIPFDAPPNRVKPTL